MQERALHDNRRENPQESSSDRVKTRTEELLMEPLVIWITAGLSAIAAGTAIFLAILVLKLRKTALGAESTNELIQKMEGTEKTLVVNFSDLRVDLTKNLESLKGEMKLETANMIHTGFANLRKELGDHLTEGRKEQTEGRKEQTETLTKSREELTRSLERNAQSLETKFDGLQKKITDSLEMIRGKVDERLQEISREVQKKLDDNIKEGFSQFEKVQQHLKAAEDHLKQVGQVGASINDLNNLLKLPHLRGKFGEDILERLLSDFLPANMYEIQKAIDNEGRLRPDAIIHLPDRNLPIDSKFPRDKITALFEDSDPGQLNEARKILEDIVRGLAKKIVKYIRPEEGTTEFALMFLPSETLWFEVVRNRSLAEYLEKNNVHPVSPNTLLMALRTISQAHKWYQMGARFKEARTELGRAQKSFGYFRKQFEAIGTSLGKAQGAYDTASAHLGHYEKKITQISGEDVPELEGVSPPSPNAGDEIAPLLPLEQSPRLPQARELLASPDEEKSSEDG